MTPDRPLPRLGDPDTGGFFAAAARDVLAVCACKACGAVLHLPRSYCHHCGAWDTTWRPVGGEGRLYSWTTVEHQVHPAFPVPYTVVLVDLVDEPGVRLAGYLPGRPELEAGMAMRVRFEPVAEDTKLPQWEPVPTTAAASSGR